MSEPLQISVHVEEKRYQPTQAKNVVPDWEPVEVAPDRGYALSKVTVEGMPEPTESETFTENGTYDVGRIGTAIVDVDIDLQNKTVTPTEQTQTVEADAGYDGLDAVTVNPIPPEYVVPTGSVEIAENGQVSVSGKATANVNVPQGVFPAGTKVITQNVTGEDVTNYAAVDVAVPGPSGTKQISITQNGTTTEDVSEYAEAEITVNTLPEKGLVFEDYDEDGYPHSARFVGTWTEIPMYFCTGYFTGDYQYGSKAGKKITSLTVPDGVVTIFQNSLGGNRGLETIAISETVKNINTSAFENDTALKSLTFYQKLNVYAMQGATKHFKNCSALESFIAKKGILDGIAPEMFNGCSAVMLYDFSEANQIPWLYSVASLDHASGCVIRIPAELSDTTLGEGNGWESKTNWAALTNIVWEVV